MNDDIKILEQYAENWRHLTIGTALLAVGLFALFIWSFF